MFIWSQVSRFQQLSFDLSAGKLNPHGLHTEPSCILDGNTRLCWGGFFIVIHMYKGPFIYENDTSVRGLSFKTPKKRKMVVAPGDGLFKPRHGELP